MERVEKGSNPQSESKLLLQLFSESHGADGVTTPPAPVASNEVIERLLAEDKGDISILQALYQYGTGGSQDSNPPGWS